MDGLASLCKLNELEYSRSSIKNEKQCLKQCLKVRSCHGCLEKFPVCSRSCRADQVQTKASSYLLSIILSLRLWDNTFTVFSTDNTDLKQPWTAIPRRSTGSQDCVVDCNLHNSRAVHLMSRRSFSPVWRCLENVSLFLNVNFEIRVFSKPNLDYILNYRY